eukprot:3635380-Prymnesium_polylepis.1
MTARAFARRAALAATAAGNLIHPHGVGGHAVAVPAGRRSHLAERLRQLVGELSACTSWPPPRSQ